MKVAFQNITFAYTRQGPPVLRNFSLQAGAGDRIAIKGPSGAGKTTLFRLLLGFEQPGEGAILLNGEGLDITKVRHQTAWLPQDLDMGEGTVQEVFLYPFEFKANRHLHPTEADILKTFTALGLSKSVWHEKFEHLSTGERQRTGIALCHHLKKPLLLLDEPTSALDDASKAKVQELLFADTDNLILSTSHDPWWLQQCNKVIELEAVN